MPKGIYIRTEKARQNISNSKKGKNRAPHADKKYCWPECFIFEYPPCASAFGACASTRPGLKNLRPRSGLCVSTFSALQTFRIAVGLYPDEGYHNACYIFDLWKKFTRRWLMATENEEVKPSEEKGIWRTSH